MEGETNGQRDPNTNLEHDICIHIFTVSSAMVGVCLTVIGLIRLRRMHRLEKIADGIFILAMIGMVIICAVITYSISIPPRPSAG
jgi:amino acid transporter